MAEPAYKSWELNPHLEPPRLDERIKEMIEAMHRDLTRQSGVLDLETLGIAPAMITPEGSSVPQAKDDGRQELEDELTGLRLKVKMLEALNEAAVQKAGDAEKGLHIALTEDIDGYYCCNGHECGCHGFTWREQLAHAHDVELPEQAQDEDGDDTEIDDFMEGLFTDEQKEPEGELEEDKPAAEIKTKKHSRRGDRDEMLEFAGTELKSTGKALLLEINGTEFWLPFSHVRLGALNGDDSRTVYIRRWLAIEKGMI